jgi:FkbM family methyltransferase
MYHSQVGQDKYLNEKIFKNKLNGVFLDIGANDGVTINNTLFFEQELNWNGICIEPNPKIYSKLILNRKCICDNCCISEINGNVTFAQIDGYSEMLSGIYDFYDPKHIDRINREISMYGGSLNKIQIPSKTLMTICEQYNIFNFDFCSIDVEGGEMSIIKSINFDKINIDYFIIENNYNQLDIREYLSKFKYEFVEKVDSDDCFRKIK